jgi:CBS domain-containing protein
MTIAEIMKEDVKCCTPDDTVQSAAEQMREEDVGFLPVCEDDGTVIGTITDRDLAIRFVADALPYDTPIRQVMTRELVYCSPQDVLQQAEQTMAERRKSRLMVLENDRLCGVVSFSDIAALEPEASLIADTLREISRHEARA